MVLVAAVTGVFSPPVAGWFAPAASPGWVWAWVDGAAEATDSFAGSDVAGGDEGSVTGGCGWESCGEVAAPEV